MAGAYGRINNFLETGSGVKEKKQLGKTNDFSETLHLGR